MWQEQLNSCVVNPIKVTDVQLIRKLLEVKILDESLARANLTDGLTIQVIGMKPFTVNAYWIVKITDIHREIGNDWKTMRDQIWDRNFLTSNPQSDGNPSLHQSEPQIFHQTNEPVNVVVKPPQPIDTSLMTTTPRDFYPLVVIVTCHEEEPERQANDVAASILLIHIKDDIVPVKNHVIKNYTKQVDGKILDVSQLFTEETLACMICYEEADIKDGRRLFCLLPCRHSPICSACLMRIRECPKCRNFIASVFDVNASNKSNNDTEPEPQNQDRDPNRDSVQQNSRSGLSKWFRHWFGI